MSSTQHGSEIRKEGPAPQHVQSDDRKTCLLSLDDIVRSAMPVHVDFLHSLLVPCGTLVSGSSLELVSILQDLLVPMYSGPVA